LLLIGLFVWAAVGLGIVHSAAPALRYFKSQIWQTNIGTIARNQFLLLILAERPPCRPQIVTAVKEK
jgi:hypothetical protein